MMAQWGVIEDGVIVNIASANEAFATSQGWLPLKTGAKIGDKYKSAGDYEEEIAELSSMVLSLAQTVLDLTIGGL